MVDLKEEQIKELYQSARKYFVPFIKLYIISNAYLVAGSFLFIYIEHCYEVVPVQLTSLENGFNELCSNLNEMKSEPYNVTLVERMRTICNKTKIGPEPILCEYTPNTFSKWISYAISIGFTIGKFTSFKSNRHL